MIEFVSFIVHKDNRRVYGSLFEDDGAMLFRQFKYVEINKGKGSPKFVNELTWKSKPVDDSIWDSFRRVGPHEFFEIEMEDFCKVG